MAIKGELVIRDEFEPTVNNKWTEKLEIFAKKKNIKLEIHPQ